MSVVNLLLAALINAAEDRSHFEQLAWEKKWKQEKLVWQKFQVLINQLWLCVKSSIQKFIHQPLRLNGTATDSHRQTETRSFSSSVNQLQRCSCTAEVKEENETDKLLIYIQRYLRLPPTQFRTAYEVFLVMEISSLNERKVYHKIK